MIKYKLRGSDWLTFALIIVNFNHFFIQPVPDRQTLVAMNCDIGLWPNGKLPGSFVEYWVERGSQDCQHIGANFFKSVQDDGKQKRWFSRSVFSRTHSFNDEKILRSWLCYSPATGRSFCFTCKLLSCSDNNVFARLGSSSSL